MLCSECRFADVSNNGELVCRFHPPRPTMVPEGTKLQFVEPAIDAKRVACGEGKAKE